MLQTHDLAKRFGATVAVDDVSVQLPEAQMVGVIGRSGAGKSTFLRLINRLIDPTHGSIHYHDLDITALKGRSLRAWHGGGLSSMDRLAP